MGTTYYPVPAVALPAKGSSIADPNFHTTITRISDKTVDGYSGPGIQNEYARTDPENSDGTHVILRGNDGTWYLYNTANNQMIKQLNIEGGGEEPEPKWEANNPKIFYYLFGTELRTYNIDTDASTVIHDFKAEFPAASYITTKVEGDASLDRRFWCFMVENDADPRATLAVIVYDKTNNNIVGQKTSFPDSINWVSMDMSGQHAVVGYDASDAQVFPRNLSSAKTLSVGARGHMDFALTADGRDVMVYQKTTVVDVIAMAELDSVAETQLVTIPFDVNTDIGIHVSGNCSQTPGWALISTYGAQNPPTGQAHSWMDTQLFMVELKANPRIWRIAHTHCYTFLNPPDPNDPDPNHPQTNYIAEAFAAINTRGTKIYFGSNWDTFTTYPILTEYTDAYQIVLPSNWSSQVPQ